jgi:hypothetical protein
VIEHVADDVVVMLPGSTEVLQLSGEAADTVRTVQRGDMAVLPTGIVTELVERGVLISRSRMSRRGFVKAGTIGLGTGIAVMSMPGVAAASSTDAPQPLQLLGFFSRIGEYFSIAGWTAYLLGDPDVLDYLADNGAPSTLPSFPDSFRSEDLSDISGLDLPELGLSNVAFSISTSRLTPGDEYLEWLPQAGSLSTAPFAVVGSFTWNEQEFEVFFFDA